MQLELEQDASESNCLICLSATCQSALV